MAVASTFVWRANFGSPEKCDTDSKLVQSGPRRAHSNATNRPTARYELRFQRLWSGGFGFTPATTWSGPACRPYCTSNCRLPTTVPALPKSSVSGGRSPGPLRLSWGRQRVFRQQALPAAACKPATAAVTRHPNTGYKETESALSERGGVSSLSEQAMLPRILTEHRTVCRRILPFREARKWASHWGSWFRWTTTVSPPSQRAADGQRAEICTMIPPSRSPFSPVL